MITIIIDYKTRVLSTEMLENQKLSAAYVNKRDSSLNCNYVIVNHVFFETL
jgi:hypothetical protein